MTPREALARPVYRAPLRPAGIAVWIVAGAILAWVVFRLLDRWWLA